MINSKYQIVTNHYIMSYIKQSQYFQSNLGFAVTLDKNGDRVLNEKDQFAASYNYQYKTTIYGQGEIGNIFFYVDLAIYDNTIAAYHNLEEFIYEFDESFVKDKGISAYLGKLLKSIDDEYSQRQKDIEEKKQNEEAMKAKVGQADKLFNNPGAVNYEDIKAYIQQKRI